jgi:hypothetical protein
MMLIAELGTGSVKLTPSLSDAGVAVIVPIRFIGGSKRPKLSRAADSDCEIAMDIAGIREALHRQPFQPFYDSASLMVVR